MLKKHTGLISTNKYTLSGKRLRITKDDGLLGRQQLETLLLPGALWFNINDLEHTNNLLIPFMY